MIQMNSFTNRNRVTDVENTLLVTRGIGRGIKYEFGINIYAVLYIKWAPLVAQMVKNLYIK